MKTGYHSWESTFKLRIQTSLIVPEETAVMMTTHVLDCVYLQGLIIESDMKAPGQRMSA